MMEQYIIIRRNRRRIIFYLYYNILILSLCTATDSASGYHTNMRPVSLNLVWSERGHRTKIVSKSDQWPNYRTKMLCH
jgi:hypothetical protein